MKIPFLDLKSRYRSLQPEIDSKIQEVVASAMYSSGPYVDEFEKSFANLHNAKFSIGVNSGTSALHLALIASGVEAGDEVILPSHTFVSTAWAISYIGAKPVFADIEHDTFTIDPKQVDLLISHKTKAIVPVHIYGQMADMHSLSQIAQNNGLALIEDAAQAHLAMQNGKMVGSWGHSSCFSFYPGKNMGAFGEAGAVLTNDENLMQRMKRLRNHAQPEKYVHDEIGFNYRMDGMQGAVLDIQCGYINDWTDKRRTIAKQYNDAFSNLNKVDCPKEKVGNKHVYHLYSLICNNKQERDNLAIYLNEKGIATGMHYPIPVHLQMAYKSLNYKKGDLPVTEKIADTQISLPLFPEMTQEQVDYIIENVVKWSKK